jgi:hypothetical protein
MAATNKNEHERSTRRRMFYTGVDLSCGSSMMFVFGFMCGQEDTREEERTRNPRIYRM